MQQHLTGPTAAPDAVRDGADRRRPPGIGPSAAAVLGLQQSAGNLAVQRLLKATPPRPSAPTPPGGHPAKVQAAGGTPLPGDVRGRMESALGADFGHVRIHTDSEAAGRAGDLNANAFTIGNQVSFAEGAYQAGTPMGDAVIAHELAHVVQQDGDASAAHPARLAAEDTAVDNSSDEHAEEAQADRAAGQALQALHGTGGSTADGPQPRTGILSRLRQGLRLRRCTPNLGKAMSKATARSVQFNASHPLTASHGDNKVNPTWTPGAADHAVAYTKGASPTVDATFDVGDFKAPAAGTTVSVRAKEGGAVRGTVSGLTPAASVRVSGLVLAGLTGSPEVRSTTYNLAWEASIDGTSWTPVSSTGIHPVYWLMDTPKVAPTPSLAVSKAAGYANGAASPADVANRLRSGPRSVDGKAYDPADPIDVDPLDVYTNGVGICTDYGNLLALLARAVGLNANAVMYYGGFENHGKMVWVTMGGSLRTLKNVKPGLPAYAPAGKLAWDFNYHVIARIQGALQDAALDRADIDAEAMHPGLDVRLIDLTAGALPAASRGAAYTTQVPRVDNTVAVTVRDFGPMVTSADFGLVMPLHVPAGAASPLEVVAGVAWRLASGTLPPGLTLNPATGKISGTPTKGAKKKTYTFTVETSGSGVTSSAAYTLAVS